MRERSILAVSAAILLLVFAVTVFAQSEEQALEKLRNTTPAQRAKLETEFMKVKLNLTPQQTKKVQSINMNYAQKMDPVIKGSGNVRARLLQMNTLNQEKDGAMKTVLSAGQYQGYMAAKEEMRQKVLERIEQKQ